MMSDIENNLVGITVGLISGRQIYVTFAEVESFERNDDQYDWTTDKSFGQYRKRSVPIINIEMLEYHYEQAVRANN